MYVCEGYPFPIAFFMGSSLWLLRYTTHDILLVPDLEVWGPRANITAWKRSHQESVVGLNPQPSEFVHIDAKCPKPIFLFLQMIQLDFDYLAPCPFCSPSTLTYHIRHTNGLLLYLAKGKVGHGLVLFRFFLLPPSIIQIK